MGSTARRFERYDRDTVVAATDLPSLLDQIVGPHRGRGGSASWPCPSPEHGRQTGRTPPVSIYLAHGREQRWHCHGCGTDGTAIDLIILTQNCTFPTALELLARTAGVRADVYGPPPLRRAPTPERPLRPSPPRPSPHLIEYVRACQEALWTPRGAEVRSWLHDRGFNDSILRANRVGADPGPTRMPRYHGLPRGGPAAVFPVLDRAGTPVYLQARYLHPRTSKYANPTAELAGPSPRIAVIRPPSSPADRQTILVCEGIPDGLAAAQAGVRTCAILGVAAADDALAVELRCRYPGRHLVLAFDADDAGRAATERLARVLAGRGTAVSQVQIPAGLNDINQWLQADPGSFQGQLKAAAVGTTTRCPKPPDAPR